MTKLHVIPESSQIMVSVLFPLNFQRYMQEKCVVPPSPSLTRIRYGDQRFSQPSSANSSAAPSPSASPSPAPVRACCHCAAPPSPRCSSIAQMTTVRRAHCAACTPCNMCDFAHFSLVCSDAERMQVLRIRVNFSIGLLISVFKETAFLGAHATSLLHPHRLTQSLSLRLRVLSAQTLPPFYSSPVLASASRGEQGALCSRTLTW